MRSLLHLAARERTRRSNRQLGGLLAFVAGAVNAGGFLAVHRYTSHMTGVVSGIADDLVLGHGRWVAAGLALLAFFLLGVIATTLLMNWARRLDLRGEIALPLVLEALLLLAFGVLGASLQRVDGLAAPATALLLCFVMGLQNAIITKASRAEIRTTHMTGIVTDLGIELGRLLYRNSSAELDARHVVRADRDRLAIHATILGLFLAGGLTGAWGFRVLGFSATLPIAAMLVAVAAPPLAQDLARRTDRAS